jgi:hypothetical protein
MEIASTALVWLAWSPVVVGVPFLGCAYYLAVQSGRVSIHDFFISSAIDLGLANRIGGTGLNVIIACLAMVLSVRMLFVSEILAHYRQPPSSWNRASAALTVISLMAGTTVSHVNNDFNPTVHLSFAFVFFSALALVLVCQSVIDTQLAKCGEDAGAEWALVGNATEEALGHPRHQTGVYPWVPGGVPGHRQARRMLLVSFCIALVTMNASIPFHLLALSSAAELVMVACLVAIVGTWATDFQHLRVSLKILPAQADAKEGGRAASFSDHVSL